MNRIWVFALGDNSAGETYWYWTRFDGTAIESKGPCVSFEACVADAKQFGFDFRQTYHLTTVRSFTGGA